MAFTEKEISYGNMLLGYYSVETPVKPRDQKKIDAFVYASEDDKRVMIKEFLTNIALPSTQMDKVNLNNSVAIMDTRITEYQDYSK